MSLDPDRIPTLHQVLESGDPAAIELARRIRETILTTPEAEPQPGPTPMINRIELEAIIDRHLEALRNDLLDALEVWLQSTPDDT